MEIFDKILKNKNKLLVKLIKINKINRKAK